MQSNRPFLRHLLRLNGNIVRIKTPGAAGGFSFGMEHGTIGREKIPSALLPLKSPRKSSIIISVMRFEPQNINSIFTLQEEWYFFILNAA